MSAAGGQGPQQFAGFIQSCCLGPEEEAPPTTSPPTNPEPENNLLHPNSCSRSFWC